MRRYWIVSLLVVGLLVPASAQAITPRFSEQTVSSGKPQDVVGGPDGALWFTTRAADGVASMTLGGTVTSFPGVGTPSDITTGPDGNLWFTDGGDPGRIGRLAPAGTPVMFPAGGNTGPTGVVAGPDGAMWFTEAKTHRIGRMTTSGTLTAQYDLPPGTKPYGIAVGGDGALWFTGESSGTIGRIAVDGTGLKMYPLPDAKGKPQEIVAGPDGALWFTEFEARRIGRITTAGSVTEYPLVARGQPSDITPGPDGALWFTDTGDAGRLGRVTTTGALLEWPITATGNTDPLGITVGPDGALWFAQSAGAALGRVTTGPGAQTLPVTDATDTTATLRGSVHRGAETTTNYFEYGLTSAYGSVTTAANAGGGPGSSAAQAAVAGLAADTTYHYRLVAANDTDTTYGPDRTFRTQPAGAPARSRRVIDRSGGDPDSPAPVLGRSVVVGTVQGHVKVRIKGASTFVPLRDDVSVPTGSELDATKGVVTMVSALDARGGSQTGRFSAGRFTVRQSRSGRGMVDLYLSGPRPGRCERASASVATKRKPKTRSLWGRDNRGRFRTHGSNSVATVRGTRWLTQDRCDGTLTRVTEGSVVVRESHRKRTTVVRAGQRHLARRR
jgi:virginiamycin B lyase